MATYSAFLEQINPLAAFQQSADLSPRKLQVFYKAPEAKFGGIVLLIFSPLWAVWLPYATYVFLQGTWMIDQEMMAVATLCLGVMLLSILAVCVCIDNKIDLLPSGFRLPSLFLLQCSLNTRRSWSSLRWIRFLDRCGPSTDPTLMVLTLTSLEEVTLSLSGFDPQNFSLFFEAVQAYAPQVEIFPALSQLKFRLNSEGHKTANNFTRLWHDELAGRFSSTTFVPLEPGTTLQSGRIKIISQLAFGGLSAVYLADCDGRLVTLKEAFATDCDDDPAKVKALEMFKREADVLKGVSHTRIARVFDHLTENGRHYLVLEHIVGKDLRRYVRENGAVQEQVALRWCAETADILAYLHQLDPPILHRDLSPDNLVLENDGSVTLIDFGAANAYLGTVTGTLVGKQAYISPEQFRGKANPGSDIYALGATLYFLLTGEDPEPLSCSHPRQVKSNLSAETDDLVAACTALDETTRLESASRMAQTARMIYVRTSIFE